MNNHRACCAHSRVSRKHRGNSAIHVNEIWVCDDCGKLFEPIHGPTDSEMLDWLDQSFSIDVAYYTGSDTAKRWWHLKRDPLDKKPLREAIAVAMRESGGE